MPERTDESHRIEWTLEAGIRIEGAISCDAPTGSPCRQACATCEGDCYCDEPVMEDLDFCNPLEWISNDDCDLVELYAGPTPHRLVDAAVEFVWEGDHYEWRYVVAGVGAGAH